MYTSSEKSCRGAPARRLMATTVPSSSRPLYTSPKPPAPTRLASAKLWVACASSSSENCLAPWNSGADEVRPHRPHSAAAPASYTRKRQADDMYVCMCVHARVLRTQRGRRSLRRGAGVGAPVTAPPHEPPRHGEGGGQQQRGGAGRNAGYHRGWECHPGGDRGIEFEPACSP